MLAPSIGNGPGFGNHTGNVNKRVSLEARQAGSVGVVGFTKGINRDTKSVAHHPVGGALLTNLIEPVPSLAASVGRDQSVKGVEIAGSIVEDESVVAAGALESGVGPAAV